MELEINSSLSIIRLIHILYNTWYNGCPTLYTVAGLTTIHALTKAATHG